MIADNAVASSSRRSPSFEDVRTEGAAAYEREANGNSGENDRSNYLSPSPRGAHPVAVVMGMSENTVTYMPSNDNDVLSIEGEDSSWEETVCPMPVAATFPSTRIDEREELKAPLHIEHLFWCCAVADGDADGLLVPVYDAPIDHGAHMVLIWDSLVPEMNLKRRKLPKPKKVETAMTLPGESYTTTMLTEYVKLKLYDPVSGWAARTVCAIVAPSLCSPIIL